MQQVSITEYLKSHFLQLDVEFGNSHGYFSASKSGLHISCFEQDEVSSEYDTKIPKSTIRIEDSVVIKKNELSRITSFITKTDSYLFDLVSRFVVLSDDRCAKIAGCNIWHKCENIYHQYSTSDVLVPVGTEGYLKFQDVNSTGHTNFENVFYIRDEAVEVNGLKRWIVHHRMIVRQHAANLIIRCCHPVFDSPLPWQNIYPRALKRKLFRIREKKYPNFPFMAVGESAVSMGYVFDIGTKVVMQNE